MASNADRQARYRQRHLAEGTATRLNMVVSAHAKAAIARLARHYGVTKRAAVGTDRCRTGGFAQPLQTLQMM
jgi:hypothetical protein